MTGRRWGFRARLTALIAAAFILGGTALLAVQYLVVQRLIEADVRTIAEIRFEPLEGCVRGVCKGPVPHASDDEAQMAATFEYTSELSDGVASDLLVWSVVVLAIFAVVAVVAAGWLSRRSLGRIAQITTATREINRDALHRRLALPGPQDEIKELGDTIDGMLDRLDDAFTRQERFVQSASHELRTPLTTTRAALEIPLAQGRVPADLEPEVRVALAANARSERLIAALLSVARSAERGRGVARATVLTADLAGLVADKLSQVRHDATARGIRIAAPPPRQLLAAADPELLEIALGNLVENGIGHNYDGGELTIRVGSDEDVVWVELENSGRRISNAEAARLTEPFNRGGESRLAGGGVGLGLTIVDTIARDQGGSVSLAPRPGGGLLTRLALPPATTGAG
ncbi:sensor histidine kinase [Georgenia yuyongxinii]|uniref:histidine kinase n=1 Tax=Georgenia yuyongxinii TaxID=2589797 RepID=A0A552WNQ4_9MICO|nr:ATP-binding protein [Georgenia yuyongxinii]TRW44401.1 HAMP domain-containing protein [Georgenia yuyongxinii]